MNRCSVAFVYFCRCVASHCPCCEPPHTAAQGHRYRRRHRPSQPGAQPPLPISLLLTPLQILLRGHDMPVQSIAVSQSGRFVASGQALSPHKGMFQVPSQIRCIAPSKTTAIWLCICVIRVGRAPFLLHDMRVLQIIIWDYTTRQALFQVMGSMHPPSNNLSPSSPFTDTKLPCS